tara:strand:+ start:390 stop:851 length:462 start_codon:yes stop_codon:yes gene_type:complete
MKKLILLTTLFLAFACSKDDEGETFLDKYDGTSWMVEEEEEIDGSGVEVFTFSNGTYFYSQVIGGGPYPGATDDCFQFKEGKNVIFGLEITYKILKNKADELLAEATLMGEVLGTIKFTPQGENLLMTETTIEDGTETTILIASDSSYSDYCN